MKKLLISTVLAASAIASAASAHVYDFTITGVAVPEVVATGQITTNPSNIVVNITGSVVGNFFNAAAGPISFTANPTANPSISNETYSPSGAFIYDDVFYPNTNPVVDNVGLLWKVGSVEYNLFTNGPGQYVLYNYQNGGYTDEAVTVAVPEPATWALMLIGFGGMGVALRRSRRLQPALARA